MNKYKVKVKFIFEGTFDVNAKDGFQAREYVEKHCGLIIGRDIHTSLSDDEIPTWDFPVHPDKKIIGIKTIK